MARIYKSKSIRGQNAEVLFLNGNPANVKDVFRKDCDPSVMQRSFWNSTGFYVCFDRGRDFPKGQYRCFQKTKDYHSHFSELFISDHNVAFEMKVPACGGDGVRLIQVM